MHWFKVPSGIGDISWVYSKLVNFKKPFGLGICGDNPRRSLPFVELLPRVEKAVYEPWTYWPIFEVQKLGLKPETDLNTLPEAEYFLSANMFLESGRHLSNFLPSLPTTYHYPFKDLTVYKKDYPGVVGRWIGVYTSKYANNVGEWRLWTVQEWTEFLRAVHYFSEPCTFFFIGAEFDNDMGNDVAREVSKFAPTVNLIAKTHIGEVITLLQSLDYLFAFPSGIGVLGDVVDCPTLHFLPAMERLRKLSGTYADPVSLKEGRHVNVTFCSLSQALEIFREKGLRFLS